MNLLIRIHRKTSFWTLLAGITFAVQVWRWSIADMWIFGTATILLFLESSGLIDGWRFNGLRLREIFYLGFTMFSAAFLYLTKRQDPELAAYFIVLAPLLFITLWNSNPKHERLKKREFKSAVFWSLIGVILGLWEMFALILSNVVHSDAAFPTISELIVPVLDESFARFQFLVLWLGVGYYFASKWRHND